MRRRTGNMRRTRSFCCRKNQGWGTEGLEMVVGAVYGPTGKLDASRRLGHRRKNGKTHPFTLIVK